MARPRVKPATPVRDEGGEPRSLFSVGRPPAAEEPDDSYDDDHAFLGELAESGGYQPDDGGSGEGDQVGEIDDVGDAAEERRDDTGGVHIPHWTEPATGEIPRVLVGDREGDDEEAWAAFADGGPRWRDDSRDFDERDDIAALADDEARLGALDPDAPGEHELLSFDDLEAPDPTRGPPRAPAKRKAPAKKVGIASTSGASRMAAEQQPGTRPPGTRRPPGAGGPGRAGAPMGGGGSRGSDRDLTTAAAVGAGLAALALVLLKIGPGAMIWLVAVIVFLAAAEFFTTTRRAGYLPAQLLGLVGCVVLPLAVYWKGTNAYPIALGLTVMCGFLWYIVGAGDERPTMNLGVTMLGIGWIGVLGSFAGLLLGAPDGSSLLLSVLLVAVANDVGALFIGQAVGRAPLTPISPGKTIEGTIGGIGAAVVVSLLFVGVLGIGPFGESLVDALLLGLVVGAATAVGDLCESVVKRDLGVKDMGNILPGHGGILDRMDGILFALPAAWYLALILF
jgi:phosphatidate cytidylyltransferase